MLLNEHPPYSKVNKYLFMVQSQQHGMYLVNIKRAGRVTVLLRFTYRDTPLFFYGYMAIVNVVFCYRLIGP